MRQSYSKPKVGPILRHSVVCVFVQLETKLDLVIHTSCSICIISSSIFVPACLVCAQNLTAQVVYLVFRAAAGSTVSECR